MSETSALITREQREALGETGHRPWPLPEGRWLIAQTWADLLFAHWRVPLAQLRRIVPEQLPVDSFDGDGWIGVVPFVLQGLRLRHTPPVAGRIHVHGAQRPYLRERGREAGHLLLLARRRELSRRPGRPTDLPPAVLPGRDVGSASGEDVVYTSRRDRLHRDRAIFRARYRPSGPEFAAETPSLEHFLTERYCLYTLDGRQRVRRADIHHPPWRLRPAEAAIEQNTMVGPLGLHLDGAPLLHFAKRQDALVWPLRREEAA
ncbi:MAG: DUF2071 domain-containing protein [Thermoleophilaceae bacterium]